MRSNKLEKEKLSLEIDALKKPFWKNMEFWKMILPATLVGVSLFLAFQQGLLDVRKETLELKKEHLSFEIDRFEVRKKELIATIAVQDSIKSAKEAEIIRYVRQISIYKSYIDSLRGIVDLDKQDLQSLVREREKDRMYFAKLLEGYEQSERKRNDELSRLENAINDCEVEKAGEQAQVVYFNENCVLTAFQKNDLQIVKLRAKTKALDEHISRRDKRIQDLKLKIQNIHNKVDTMDFEDARRYLEMQILMWNKEK